MTTVNREQAVVAGAVVRLWADADTVVGSGFLVGPGQVATCAHVVAEALGTDPLDPTPPTGRVRLDFPLGGGASVAAAVQRWSPDTDLAILHIDGPAPTDARMPPLRRIEHAGDRAFSVLGFPAGLVDGVWSTGVVTETSTLQANPGEQPIGVGFAGAPVWDTQTGAVIGMARATHHLTVPALVPVDEVLGLDPERLPCPYRGLEPFGEEHAAAFHGRDDDVVRLLEATENVPVVAVAGPSGAGKSSLIRAGLLPRLRAAGVPVLDFHASAGTDAVAALDDAVRQAGGNELLVVIDQFEELAAVEPTTARLLLERVVQHAADRAEPGDGPHVRAVLTVRWTALDELLTPELTSTLEGGTLLIAPLDRDQLRAAIVGPAALPPGLAFEQGLVDRILDDAGAEPGQLPLVESLLATLWEHRAGGYLTHRGYEEAGGVAGAVAEHADQVVGALPADTTDALRRLFTALARPDTDGRFVRRPVPLAQLPADQRALVPALAAGRLVVVSGPEANTVELAHQALIEHWPRLRGWLDADRQFLAWREQLGTHRERWEVESRAETALLRGAPLAAAAEWVPRRRDDLAPADADYLRRSTARQRREVRRWRTIIAVLAVLVLAGATLAVVAVRGGNEAAAQLALTNADTIGRDARARARDDATTAAQLALTAWKADPSNPQARSALAAAYLALQSAEVALAGVTESPTRTLAVGGDTAVLVGQGVTVAAGISGPNPEYRPLPDIGQENLVALSPDGRTLADSGPDGTVRTRDLATRGEPRPLRGTGGGRILQNLQFSPDGTRLAWLAPDAAGQSRLVQRDLHTEAEIPNRLGQLPAEGVDVTLTVDPDVVLVRYADPDRAMKSARVVQRSLSDGGTAVAYPAGSEATPTSVVSCEPPPKPGKATIVVSPIRGGESRRIPSGWDCAGALLSGERGWLIQRPLLDDFTSNQLLVLTDLATGATRQVWAPQLNDQRGGIVAPTAFTTSPLIRIGRSAGAAADRPAVWMAGGTSLVRLGTEAPIGWTGNPPTRNFSFAERYWVGLTGDGFAVADRTTGTQVSALAGVLGPKSSWSLGETVLSVMNPAPTGWVLKRYTFPELRPINEFTVPVTAPDGARHKASIQPEDPDDGGGVLVMADGVLSAWDQNGNPRGTPVKLESTTQWYLENPRISGRPGHPGQALVVTPLGALELWDVVAGKVIGKFATVVALNAQIVFDPPGNLIGTLTNDEHVEVWDVATGKLVGPRAPAPDGSDVLGFDPDGHLAVAGRNGNSFVQGVTLFDARQGRESASVQPDATPVGMFAEIGVAHTMLDGGQTPAEVPLLARTWHDRLCSVINRPFTAGELRLLPPGTDRSPPC